MAVLPEWARVVNTTYQHYFKEVDVNTLRNDKLLAMLENDGRVMLGMSGQFLDWKVEYRMVPVFGYADMDQQSFQRQNLHKTAQLEWRGYSATDAVSKKERLMNQGVEGIVKIFENKGKDLAKAITRHFSDESYIDGNASGNTKRVHGFDSFTGTDGATVLADKVAKPSDTYAGLKTDLGDAGGTLDTGTWPEGTQSEEYDYWSPILVNWSSSAWVGATNDFRDSAIEILRYGIIHSQKDKGQYGQLKMILLNRQMYGLFLDKAQTEERFVVTRREGQGLTALGFTDVVNLDGVDISHEYAIAANTGYGFNTSYIELHSMQDVLFKPEGPYYDEATKSWRFDADFFGNYKFNPRCMVKWSNYAAS